MIEPAREPAPESGSAGSLADQAATWVPPWARRRPGSDRVEAPAPPPVAEPVVATEPVVVAEAPPTPAAEPVVVPRQLTAALPEPVTLPAAELRAAVEAIMLVVDEPVTEIVLAQVLEQPTNRISVVIAELAREYTLSGRGFDLRRVAGGWRLYTRPEYAGYVERFVLDGQHVRLTQAALETLAVVAYKQPVTRSRISAIRGVNCDGVVRTLVSRGLIEVTGTEPDSGAFLYRTTTLFLEKLGVDGVDELPPLAPFLPDDVEEIADAQR